MVGAPRSLLLLYRNRKARENGACLGHRWETGQRDMIGGVDLCYFVLQCRCPPCGSHDRDTFERAALLYFSFLLFFRQHFAPNINLDETSPIALLLFLLAFHISLVYVHTQTYIYRIGRLARDVVHSREFRNSCRASIRSFLFGGAFQPFGRMTVLESASSSAGTLRQGEKVVVRRT